METLTWKQFGCLPLSLRIRGGINDGPDRAYIHHPLRDWSVGYILYSTLDFDVIRFCRVKEVRTFAARSANGGPASSNVAPACLEANE